MKDYSKVCNLVYVTVKRRSTIDLMALLGLKKINAESALNGISNEHLEQILRAGSKNYKEHNDDVDINILPEVSFVQIPKQIITLTPAIFY